MGRQIIYYLLDKEKIMKIAEVIADEGFELIETIYAPNREIHYRSIPTTRQMLFDAAIKPGIIRLRKSEYEEYRCLADLSIDWMRTIINEKEKVLQHGRIYLCTWHFDRYREETIEQITKDYKLLYKTVSKLVPMKTVTVNDVTMRARWDEMAVEYLKKGYNFR